MQFKKILATVALAAVLVTSASACGNGESADNSSTQSVVSVEELSLSSTAGAGYSSDNDTKVRQMLEKVTFNGEPLTIPYKASDLGEGFTFSEDVNTYKNDEGEEFNVTALECGTNHLCSVTLYEYNGNQDLKDSVAYTISYSSVGNQEYIDLLQIDGIDGSSTMEDVLEKFGKPTKSEYASGYAYDYEIDDYTCISFWGNEKNEMVMFIICDKPKS